MKKTVIPYFTAARILLACSAVSLSVGPLETAVAQSTPFSAQESMASLLQKGELTLVETRPDGNLKQVTAIVVVKRPPEEVWARLTHYPGYLKWMPKVIEGSVLKKEGTSTDVQWEIEVPGPNYRYVARNTEDRPNWIIRQKQVSGALKGSHWSWQLVPQGNQTLVFRTVYTNVTDESWIARQMDDESHTLPYGINVSTSLLEVKALRRALEGGR